MPHDPPLHSDSGPEIQPEHSAPGHPVPHIVPIQTDDPLRHVLPWILSAAAVLGLLLVMLFAVLPHLSQVPRHSQSPPLPSDPATVLPPADPALPPPAPAQPLAAKTPAGDASVPLAVTLYSAGNRKHVPVGTPVLISAYASLPPTGSATIAISYARNGGPQSLLTLAQGSLSTASWTPAAPGRYDFTASALDSHKISAFSRHIAINVDAPPAPAQPSSAAFPAPLTARVAAPVQPPRAATPRPSALVPLAAVRRPALRSTVVKEAAPAKAPRSRAYHVAAAAFVARPLAETLAGALRRRGFHASVQPSPGPFHRTSYVVQTGDYLRSADAQKQATLLKQDGYPSYVFQVR